MLLQKAAPWKRSASLLGTLEDLQKEEWKTKGISETEIRRDVKVIMPSLDLLGKLKQCEKMAIIRSKIARQLLADGGVSLDDAKMMAPQGEFLAYINPKEAGVLKSMGGSGKMTPMGIPSFTEDEAVLEGVKIFE